MALPDDWMREAAGNRQHGEIFFEIASANP